MGRFQSNTADSIEALTCLRRSYIRRSNNQYSVFNMSILKEMFNFNVNNQRQFSSQCSRSISSISLAMRIEIVY